MKLKTFEQVIKMIGGGSTTVNLLDEQGKNTLAAALEASGFDTEGMDAQVGSGDPIAEDKWADTVVDGEAPIYLIESIAGGSR